MPRWHTPADILDQTTGVIATCNSIHEGKAEVSAGVLLTDRGCRGVKTAPQNKQQLLVRLLLQKGI